MRTLHVECLGRVSEIQTPLNHEVRVPVSDMHPVNSGVYDASVNLLASLPVKNIYKKNIYIYIYPLDVTHIYPPIRQIPSLLEFFEGGEHTRGAFKKPDSAFHNATKKRESKMQGVHFNPLDPCHAPVSHYRPLC